MPKATDLQFIAALRFARLNIHRMSFVLLAGTLASGCTSGLSSMSRSTLYVHDTAVEKSMIDTRTAFDNAKINDVFDRQSKYFDQLQAEEIAAVKARDTAQRDGQLLLFLTGNEGIDGLSLMSNDIDTRLLFFYGPDSDPEHPLWRRIDNMRLSADMDKTILDGYERAVRDYRKAKGTRPTDCVAVLVGLTQGNDDNDANNAYTEIEKRCKQIQTANDLEAKQKPAPPPATPAPPPATKEYGAFSFPLNFFVAQNEIKRLQVDLNEKQKAADELKKGLDQTENDLKTSIAIGKTIQEQVIKLIPQALSQVETYEKNPIAKMVVSDTLATKIQMIIDATGPALTKCSSPSAPAPLAAPATDAAVNSTASATPPDQVCAALALFQAAAGVGDAFSDPPRVPHPNVLAVARAQMSYSRDAANAEIADLKAQVDAAGAKLNAITTAIYMLSRAKTEIREIGNVQVGVTKRIADLQRNLSLRESQISELQKVGPNAKIDISKLQEEQASINTQISKLEETKVTISAGQGLGDFLAALKQDTIDGHAAYRHGIAALFYYSTAWNRGEILADEIEVASNIASRRSTMERSRRAAQAWIETIKPGLDTLVAYGNGGIDPKTVAQVLGGLGLVATGVGVNR